MFFVLKLIFLVRFKYIPNNRLFDQNEFNTIPTFKDPKEKVFGKIARKEENFSFDRYKILLFGKELKHFHMTTIDVCVP